MSDSIVKISDSFGDKSKFEYTVRSIRNDSKCYSKYKEYKEGESSDDYFTDNEYINHYKNGNEYMSSCDDYEYIFEIPTYTSFDLNLPQILMEKFPSIRMYTKIKKSLVNTISGNGVFEDCMYVNVRHNFISTIYTDKMFNIIINYSYISDFEQNKKTKEIKKYPSMHDYMFCEVWTINILFPNVEKNYEQKVCIVDRKSMNPPDDNIKSTINKIVEILNSHNIH